MYTAKECTLTYLKLTKGVLDSFTYSVFCSDPVSVGLYQGPLISVAVWHDDGAVKNRLISSQIDITRQSTAGGREHGPFPTKHGQTYLKV